MGIYSHGSNLHWISTNKFTVAVIVDDAGIITNAAPMVRKFEGQPIANLLKWAERFGGLKHKHYQRNW